LSFVTHLKFIVSWPRGTVRSSVPTTDHDPPGTNFTRISAGAYSTNSNFRFAHRSHSLAWLRTFVWTASSPSRNRTRSVLPFFHFRPLENTPLSVSGSNPAGGNFFGMRKSFSGFSVMAAFFAASHFSFGSSRAPQACAALALPSG
jgi:hypothetical protein